jgi:hypothetical protein
MVAISLFFRLLLYARFAGLKYSEIKAVQL